MNRMLRPMWVVSGDESGEAVPQGGLGGDAGESLGLAGALPRFPAGEGGDGREGRRLGQGVDELPAQGSVEGSQVAIDGGGAVADEERGPTYGRDQLEHLGAHRDEAGDAVGERTGGWHAVEQGRQASALASYDLVGKGLEVV